ncbi:hypothetical protein NQ317_008914 [Molorchus minor]|uniref:Integrase zinc-binding domain-containing protein n=1 Tax=Molorchus minor TaxID=1323400 RepID=A0ABQ9JU92_9CUCU|nr:hypothetical protein NQ317_008914 [Molorchus minor]
MIQWWNDFQHALPLLSQFNVPRHIGAVCNSSAMLIGFADACQTSYGAVELVSSNSWYHVESKENISDCLSRGLSPSHFIENKLWLSGPLWLKEEPTCWPIRSIGKEQCTNLEEKPVSLVTLNHETNSIYLLAGRCSSWLKLLRSVVYVLRFLKLLPRSNSISADNLAKAELVIIKIVQKFNFFSEIKMLESNGHSTSFLKCLRPFMHEGILRVGGRLVNSRLEFGIQHPILLPKHDRFVDLLIDHYHSSNLHTGPHLLLSILRQKYWILSARSIVRHRIKKCNVCFKLNPKPQFPLMGNLPSFRVQEAKAFLHTGVDPLQIIPWRKRGVRSQKAYISVFCMYESPNTPPLHWPLGIITEAFSGKDGQVRVVSVKTKTGIYKRPVVKVCPLPTQ